MNAVNDVRWQCRGCGRFISEDNIQNSVEADPSAYYGIAECSWFDCPACGDGQDVLCVVVQEGTDT